MNFSYENQNHSTYLTYQIATEDIVDSMTLGMITNNKIQGIAQTIFTQVNSTKFLKYNVSAKISVQQFFSGVVSKSHLVEVFKGIMSAIINAEEYMIDMDSLVFDVNYIFTDVSKCETVLICLPIIGKIEEKVDLNLFFKNIMFSTQFDQSENCDYIAKILNYLNSTPIFSVDDFYNLLMSIDGKGVTEEKGTVQKKESSTQENKSISHVPSMSNNSTVTKNVVQPQKQPVVMETEPVRNQEMPIPSVKNNIAINKAQSSIAPKTKPEISQSADDSKGKGLFSFLQSNKNRTDVNVKKDGIKTETVLPNKGFNIPSQNKQVLSQNKGFAIPGQPAPPPVVKSMQQGQPVMGQMQVPNKPVQPQAYNNFTKPQNSAPAPQPVPVQPVQPVAPAPQIQSAPQSKPMNFGETTVLNAGGTFGETTVLNAGMMQQEIKIQPYLIRSKNNERIELNKPVFRIGKEKSYVDYFIGDNTAISRSHANIISRDGAYFVVDTNSTNHTYVNGTMIQSNVETEISDGTQIRLANEDFQFKLK